MLFRSALNDKFGVVQGQRVTTERGGGEGGAGTGAQRLAPKVPAGRQALEVLENSVGMKMVLIPAGEFIMGSASPQAEPNEQPVRKVRVAKAFLLGQTEVTQKQFEQVMETTPWQGMLEAKDGPDFAASYITWNEAVIFCERLTESEKASGRLKGSVKYRLPTEAEWEYACRAGTTTTWSFGNDAASLSDHAWWGAFFGDGKIGRAHV